MCMVSINIPEEILLDLHENQADFAGYVRQRIALDLYINKKVSLGHCADLAGMTKEEFVQYLGQNSVSIFSFDSEEDFAEELRNA